MATGRRNRGWIWFFAVLGILALIALAVPFFYTPLEPLTRERLQEAHKLWLRKRPANYDLEYEKQGNASGNFLVKVRNGRVETVLMKQNDRDPPLPLEERHFTTYDMGGILKDIDDLLDRDDRKDAPPATNRIAFAPEDGHLLRFIRSVPGENYKQGIKVIRLTPVAPDGSAAEKR